MRACVFPSKMKIVLSALILAHAIALPQAGIRQSAIRARPLVTISITADGNTTTIPGTLMSRHMVWTYDDPNNPQITEQKKITVLTTAIPPGDIVISYRSEQGATIKSRSTSGVVTLILQGNNPYICPPVHAKVVRDGEAVSFVWVSENIYGIVHKGSEYSIELNSARQLRMGDDFYGGPVLNKAYEVVGILRPCKEEQNHICFGPVVRIKTNANNGVPR